MRKNFGVKSWFYPLPVLIVGSYDENGKANAMNAAWGGLYESNLVELCLDEHHQTTQNILKKKAFTVSFGNAKNVVACDYVGMVSGTRVLDKMEKAGFTTVKSEFVDAPIIEQLPMTLECVLETVTENGNIIGRIVNISADETIINKDGLIDVKLLNPICFDPIYNDYLTLGDKVGDAFKDGKKLK